MIILLTNDDGLGAPGLEALVAALHEEHEVWTIAPDREMSGRSHGITLSEGLKVERFPDRRFSVRGTPVDCVNLAVMALMDSPPDLCISGINRGPNLGTDIVYSGTCAAAREASFRGVPSVAASCASLRGPWMYDDAARFISENLENLLALSGYGRFVNFNWPETARQKPEVKICSPGIRRYMDEMVQFTSPRGGEYWFLQPASIESDDENGTDIRAVLEGNIAVSPILVEPGLAPMASIHDKLAWRGT